MKSRTLMCITAMTLFAALAVPVRMAAQDSQGHKSKHHHYKLIDMGTFGGPQSYVNSPDVQVVPVINKQGTVAGWADTSAPDPFPAFCFNPDCFVSHAFQWQNGVMTDLGVLPGGASSASTWISASGLIAGLSENGLTDPLIPGFPPELRAVLWKDGEITDLGTLEGGNESIANAVNSRGQVVGVATNAIPDPSSMFGTTEARAFLWQNGVMQDLGTLGGTDAQAVLINESGQVVGWSYTSSAPSPSCGPALGFLATGSFLWDKSKGMVDLGTLGGTCTLALDLNSRGQVVGTSFLTGDQSNFAFLWDRGTLTDLGGGISGAANAINDAGEIVGVIALKNGGFHAAFWKNGLMTDLGNLGNDVCTFALSINSRGQLVGGSGEAPCGTNLRAFLSEDGGPLVDLNTLIPPGSALHLTFSETINDRGEIAGRGVLPNGDQHALLLIPCGEGDDGCQGESSTGVTQNSPAPATPRSTTAILVNPALGDRPATMLDRLRSRWGQRYHLPGSGTGPTD